MWPGYGKNILEPEKYVLTRKLTSYLIETAKANLYKSRLLCVQDRVYNYRNELKDLAQ